MRHRSPGQKEYSHYEGGTNMNRLLRILLLLLLWVTSVAAQTATVTRNVNLRPEPSTDNDPIQKLTRGMQVQLIEPDPTSGFLHVRLDDQTGWVWGKSVKVQPAPSPVSSGDAGTPEGGGPASEVSSDWEKPAPQDNVFHSVEGDCGET